MLSGCGERSEEAVKVVTVTNVIESVCEVVVTNRVVVTVTNRVEVQCAPERVLSSRKTAPYAVSSQTLDAEGLRKVLSNAGARVIECGNGSVALVEASDKAVGAATMGGVVIARELTAADKIVSGADGDVRVMPVSTIDLRNVADAIRAEGGKVVQIFAVGKPSIRAKLAGEALRKIAVRGDVRRIERDVQ